MPIHWFTGLPTPWIQQVVFWYSVVGNRHTGWVIKCASSTCITSRICMLFHAITYHSSPHYYFKSYREMRTTSAILHGGHLACQKWQEHFADRTRSCHDDLKSICWYSSSLPCHNLGARPYPGMSREEVIEGIHNGYRMPKPAFCSDSLWVSRLPLPPCASGYGGRVESLHSRVSAIRATNS